MNLEVQNNFINNFEFSLSYEEKSADLIPGLDNGMVIQNIFSRLTIPVSIDLEKVTKSNTFVSKVSKGWESNLKQYINKAKAEIQFFEKNTLSAGETIKYVKENNFSIVNLNKFQDLSEENLDELFTNNSNVKHLMIHSDHITRLPEACSKLQTLNCNFCSNLKALPTDMSELIRLNCFSCTVLAELPKTMPALTELNCSVTAITKIQGEMPELIFLDALCCKKLTEIEGKMLALQRLFCSGSSALTKISLTLPVLEKFYKIDCNSLSEYPLMPSSVKINDYGYDKG